jgi:hypothetical protein
MPELVEAAGVAYAEEVARLAMGVIVEATAGALRSDWSHSARCLYAARLRTARHDAACRVVTAQQASRWSARR